MSDQNKLPASTSTSVRSPVTRTPNGLAGAALWIAGALRTARTESVDANPAVTRAAVTELEVTAGV